MNTSTKIAAGIVAELARRGRSKGELSSVWGITKTTVYSKLANGDLTTDEVDKAAAYLGISFIDLVKSSIDAPSAALADSSVGRVA